MDCVRTGRPVTVTDLNEAAHRWPRFTAALAGRGTYRSVHACRCAYADRPSAG